MTARPSKIFVLLLAAWAVPSSAQLALPQPIESLDLDALSASSITVGRLKDYSASLPKPSATYAVEETIKGEAQAQIVGALPPPHLLEQWNQSPARLLIFSWPERGRIRTISLDEPFQGLIAADLTVLDDPKRLVRYLRDLVRRHPKPENPERFVWYDYRRSGEAVGRLGYPRSTPVIVPATRELERRAIDSLVDREIASRIQGIQALRLFRSEANVARLKGLLRDSTVYRNDQKDGTEVRDYPIRRVAEQVLQEWGVPIAPPPVLKETVSVLDTVKAVNTEAYGRNLGWLKRTKRLESLQLWFSVSDAQLDVIRELKGLNRLVLINSEINDAQIKRLSGLRELREIDLSGSRITDASVATLKAFPKLKTIRLGNTGVSDEGLQTLRDFRKDMTVLPLRMDVRAVWPAPMAALTDALCERTAFRLQPGRLDGLSSRSVGNTTGEIAWSRSPSGRDLLGPFGQQSLTLRIGQLPKHRNVQVEMELFVIGSWDGNGDLGPGADVLDVRVPGVGVLLHSSFFNNDEGAAAEVMAQSYPDLHPGGRHRGYTGAAEVRSLGYTMVWDGETLRRDAVYRLRWTFAHEADALSFMVSGLTQTPPVPNLLDDEAWGIGSLTVRTD